MAIEGLEMPNIREKLLIPVEVPAWGVFTALVAGAFAFGILYNQLAMLVKNQEKLDLVYERQITNIQTVSRHDETIRDHESRIQALERGQK